MVGLDQTCPAVHTCHAWMKCAAQDSVEHEQVISSLDTGYTFEDSQDVIEPLWYKDVFSIDEEGNTVIKIPAHLHHGGRPELLVGVLVAAVGGAAARRHRARGLH
jgi:hypothetical protein